MNFKKDFKILLFTFEFILFLSAFIICVFTGEKLLNLSQIGVYEIEKISPFQFLVSFFIATLFILIILKTTRGRKFFTLFFAIAIFVGSQVIFGAFSLPLLSVILALLIVLTRFFLPFVWTHDLVIILGIGGIAVSFGMGLSLNQALIILSILSFYDILAVYKTGHMVKLFQGLLEKGIIFSLIVPEEPKGFLKPLKEVKPRKGFLYLGGGDLAFPIILSIAALNYGINYAWAVVLGTLAGLLATHLIFVSQTKSRSMAALPPIALGAILGILVAMVCF